MSKKIKYIVYFDCILLPHMFILERVQIELFHVLRYPSQIDQNRCLHPDTFLSVFFNNASKSGVYQYVADLFVFLHQD